MTDRPATLRELKESGYRPISIKAEMRRNLLKKIRNEEEIKKLNEERQGLIFLLWGKFAQEKSQLIDGIKHHVLKASHPSPYSATNGFFGCKHFSKTNEILKQNGVKPIEW